MIKTSDLLSEVYRIQKIMPEVEYYDRLDDLMQHGDDMVAGDCVYVVNNQPTCIVGLAMHNLDVSIDRLYDYENSGCTDIVSVVYFFKDDFDIDDILSVDRLSRIQENQDAGMPWGDC